MAKFAFKTGPFFRLFPGTRNVPAFADIDNDGDLDAFIGDTDGTINFYRNDGNATSANFMEVTGAGNPFNGVDVGFNSAPALVDIDNDGDLDAFIGEGTGTINFYRNDGTALAPTLTSVTGAGNPFNGVDVGSGSIPEFADIDDDGDLDAFIGESDGTINFYQNDGTAAAANFTSVTGASNPFDGVDVGSRSAPAFADIDNDGDLDAFIGEGYGEIKFYQNDGTAAAPTFTSVTGTGNPFNGVSVGSSSFPAFADIDNDGDLDAFIGEPARLIHFYENIQEVEFSAASFSDSENVGTSNAVTLTRTGDPRGISTVQVSITGGTATGGGTDYDDSSFPLTVTFNAGETSKTLAIPITNESLYEPGGDETITLRVASVSNAVITAQSTTTLNITDDDPEPTVTLAIADSPLAENGGVATVTADLSNPFNQDVTVDLGFSGTATGSGTDYTASGTSIVIPAGSTTGSITITGVDDSTSDIDETVIVDITSVTNGTESGTQQVTATITDDDPEIEVLDGTADIADGTTTALDFGSVTIGGTLSKTFTINNLGSAALNLSNLTLPTGFSLSGSLPATIAAGGNNTITIDVDTSAVASPSGTLQFDTNDSDENPFDFAISAEVIAPEIQVLDGTADIADGTATALNFGSATVGDVLSKTFTINNLGSAALNLSNLTLPAGFSLSGSLPATIAAGGNNTITIDVDTSAVASLTGTLQFDTDDSDENPFDFPISAEVTATPVPEIEVLDGTADIADGTATALNFGSVTVGDVLSKTFTINNLGSAALNLSNLSLPAGFSLSGSLPATIAAGSNNTITINVDTSAVASPSGTLQFDTDDSDENPFDFAISAEVSATPVPEIQVLDGTADIADGTATALNFGSATVGDVLSKTFTINNLGSAALNLSNLSLPAGFSLSGSLPATIAAGGNDTITINVDTSVVASPSGTLQFATNDSDENPFDFPISAEVSATPDPEIQVLDGTADIADGTATALNFGSATVGGTLSKTFTINNLGSATLNLSNLSLPTGFSISGSMPATIAAGGSNTITIDVDTSAAGSLSGTLQFDTNDSDENPFDFAISATVENQGTVPVAPVDIPQSGLAVPPATTASGTAIGTGGTGTNTDGSILDPTPGIPVIVLPTVAPNSNAVPTNTATPNPDAITGSAGNDEIRGLQGEDNLFLDNGSDFANGNQNNDYLDGGNGSDTLRGGQGNDVLIGNNGNDFVLGDFGSDTVFGSSGNDRLNGNQDSDLVSGGIGNDTVRGGKANDTVSGGAGSDEVYGDLGDDLLEGNEGNDTVIGGAGNDTASGNAGDDNIFGLEGNDILDGNDGNDFANGNQGEDTVDGGAGNDILRGGADNDLLIGAAGNDVLWGDLGNDTLVGQGDSDTFVLRPGDGSDVILDFTDGSDFIGLSLGLTFAQLSLANGSNGATISLGSEVLATLSGVDVSVLTEADFVTV